MKSKVSWQIPWWKYPPLDLDNLVEEYLDTKTDPPYSREELEAWIDKVGNDEEWKLTGNLIRGEYREAFGALPEDIGPVIMDELLLYEDKVFKQGNPDSMEDFLNGMLYYNGSCCNYEGELPVTESVDNGRKYMSILMSTRMAELDAIENYDEIPEECYRIFLYHSLFNDHTRFDGGTIISA